MKLHWWRDFLTGTAWGVGEKPTWGGTSGSGCGGGGYSGGSGRQRHGFDVVIAANEPANEQRPRPPEATARKANTLTANDKLRIP